MGENGVQTLLTGRGLLESPRWHRDRLYVSDWSTGEVIALDLTGRSEVIAHVQSLPLCTAWLPDSRLLIVSSPDGRLLRREPGGALVTHAELARRAGTTSWWTAAATPTSTGSGSTRWPATRSGPARSTCPRPTARYAT